MLATVSYSHLLCQLSPLTGTVPASLDTLQTLEIVWMLGDNKWAGISEALCDRMHNSITVFFDVNEGARILLVMFGKRGRDCVALEAMLKLRIRFLGFSDF